jgi:murein DD-endopeptidase MepM/ murein hydrolase activator NlpD
MLLRTVTPLLMSLCVALLVAATAAARPQVATLDLALRAGKFYTGLPPAAELGVTGVADRAALGIRPLRVGEVGRDVAELQLALAWQGFASGTFDGRFGPRLESALTRFQKTAAIPATGVAGRATLVALQKEPKGAPIPLVWPVLAPLGDGFGPRGDSFHAGIDLLAPAGTDVIAAAPGRVTWAGPRAGGWGNLVTIAHGHGVRTLYAHLSVIEVRVGQWVAGGTVLGRVGATGDATGPHLHFEVRIGNAAIDPLRALVPLPTSG